MQDFQARIQLFADSAQFTSMRYSVGADKVTPYYEYRGSTSFTSATAALNTVLLVTLPMQEPSRG